MSLHFLQPTFAHSMNQILIELHELQTDRSLFDIHTRSQLSQSGEKKAAASSPAGPESGIIGSEQESERIIHSELLLPIRLARVHRTHNSPDYRKSARTD